MRIVVFCGPTISAADVRRRIDADVRPPAKRGDLLAAALEEPPAIALIDGYFDRVPAVWHKEILWAMSRGIHVFGASSMGALRAAELREFGMVGVGEIYRAYCSGELEDDDEVAVVHADVDTGYRALSEAMVNIRWTLEAAARDGIISNDLGATLLGYAKSLPYERRSLRALVAPGPAHAHVTDLAALRDWLPTGRLDRKRTDALELIQELVSLEHAGWEKKRVQYEFAETDGWAMLYAQTRATLGREPEAQIDRGIEEELLARGGLGDTLTAATMRWLALERLRMAHGTINARAVESWIDQFRRDRELYSAESFDAWLQTSGLEESDLEDFFRREAVVAATRAELRGRLAGAVADELRAAGKLTSVRAAAASREAVLSAHGLLYPRLEAADLEDSELWSWFFERHLVRPVPSSLAAYAAEQGSTLEVLRRVALKQFLFDRLQRRRTTGE